MNDRRQTALTSLLRARANAVDSARRALAEAIEAEEIATRAAREAAEAILVETAVATRATDDGAVESFGRWLVEAGRPAQIRAEAARLHAEAEATVARAALGVARGDALAVERAVAAHAAERRRDLARRAGHDADDAARAAIGRRPPG